jgi:hypothetical protein
MKVDPTEFLTQMQGMESAIEAYKAFDRREDGLTRVYGINHRDTEAQSVTSRRVFL